MSWQAAVRFTTGEDYSAELVESKYEGDSLSLVLPHKSDDAALASDE